jgi:quercetin dioxygenase-like cupin family protein
MLMITIHPGGCSGTGLHSRETEICAFVFSGKIRLQLGETSHILCRGDLIAIPAGTLHRWENMAGKASQLLMIAARSVR